jgi:preprotein translocase subunit SecD
VPDWLEKIGAKPMLLGLDLQGGVHFLMEVDQKAALEKRLDATAEDLRVLLRDNRVAYESVERRADNSIVATLKDPAVAEKARAGDCHQPAAACAAGAGQHHHVQMTPIELQRIATEAIEQNVGTLRNRVNALGVAEPIIQRQGSDRVVVQLPGVQDTAQAKRILGATATLEYRAVVEGNAYDAGTDRQRARRGTRVLPQGEGRGRQADPDPAQQARDRLG